MKSHLKSDLLVIDLEKIHKIFALNFQTLLIASSIIHNGYS